MSHTHRLGLYLVGAGAFHPPGHPGQDVGPGRGDVGLHHARLAGLLLRQQIREEELGAKQTDYSFLLYKWKYLSPSPPSPVGNAFSKL